MIRPNSLEEIAELIDNKGKLVLFFTADWCPDCQFIYPHMAEIEASFPELTFVRVDRDAHLPLAQQLDIFGIPSFVVLENGHEVARYVNRLRKTKAQVIDFLRNI